MSGKAIANILEMRNSTKQPHPRMAMMNAKELAGNYEGRTTVANANEQFGAGITYSELAKSMIKGLLTVDIKSRLTASDVL